MENDKFNVENVMHFIKEEIKRKEISVAEQYLASRYYKQRVEECKNKKDIIIFGAGDHGRSLCSMLQKEGINTVRGFCDNNIVKYGKIINGLYVFSLDYVMRNYPDAFFFITAAQYENEIMRQLSRAGVSADNMAIFIRAYSGL